MRREGESDSAEIAFLVDMDSVDQVHRRRYILHAVPTSPFRIISLLERIMLFQDPEGVVSLADVNRAARATLYLSSPVKQSIFPLLTSVLLKIVPAHRSQFTLASTDNFQIGITAPFRGDGKLLFQDILTEYLLSNKPFLQLYTLKNATSNAAEYIQTYLSEMKRYRSCLLYFCVLSSLLLSGCSLGALLNPSHANFSSANFSHENFSHISPKGNEDWGPLIISADGYKTGDTFLRDGSIFTGLGSEITCGNLSTPANLMWPSVPKPPHLLFHFPSGAYVVGPWILSQIYSVCGTLAKFCTSSQERQNFVHVMRGLGVYCQHRPTSTSSSPTSTSSPTAPPGMMTSLPTFFPIMLYVWGGFTAISLAIGLFFLLRTWYTKSPTVVEEKKYVPLDTLIPVSPEQLTKLTDLFAVRTKRDDENVQGRVTAVAMPN